MGASEVSIYPNERHVVLDSVFQAGSASAVGLTVKAAPSHTASIVEVKDSSGANIVRIDQYGRIFGSRGGVDTDRSRIFGGNYPTDDVEAYFQTASTADRGIVVKGTSGQTANLQEWQDSAGNSRAFIRPGGQMAITPDAVAASSAMFISGGLATAVKLEVRASASQTANIAEFQNSAGTVLSGIDASGRLHYSASGDISTAALGGYVGTIGVNINGTIRRVPYYA